MPYTIAVPAQVLRLENNRLEALPDNIGELPNLTKLDISTNCLRQLPASMGRLKRIQRIDAANNMLVRVPPSMGHLKTIKELNLRYNNLDDRYKAKADEGLSRYVLETSCGHHF
jgi:Leucine-rich repeat (LRR) protein